jgi:hypothetical protein
VFAGRRTLARRRQEIVAANRELQERELIKLARLAGVLRRRGANGPAADLAAEVGIAVFRVAFERWVSGTDDTALSDIIARYANDVGAVTAGRHPG